MDNETKKRIDQTRFTAKARMYGIKGPYNVPSFYLKMLQNPDYDRGPTGGGAEGVSKNVKPNLSSGTRGTSNSPVGGPRTVGTLESLVGQVKNKAYKKRKYNKKAR